MSAIEVACGSSPDQTYVHREEREAHDHGHREHVAERAPEEQLDVHQPVLDDGVGERERDERERP